MRVVPKVPARAAAGTVVRVLGLAGVVVIAACGPAGSTPTTAPTLSVTPAAAVPTLTLEATVDGFRGAASIVATSDAVWVLSHSSAELVRIDPTTNEATANIALGTGFANGLGLAGGRLWMFQQSAGEVVGVDPATAKIVASVKLGQDGDGFWVGDDAAWMITDGKLVRIDAATSEVLSFSLDASCDISGAASGGGVVWLGSASGGLCKVDATTGVVTARGTGAGRGIGLTIVDGSLWLVSVDDGLTIIDLATLAVAVAVPPPPSGTFQGSTYSIGRAGGESTVVVGNAGGRSGWLRYTGATIGWVRLDPSPTIVLFAGFPAEPIAGGVVEAFGSLWVTNFGAGTTERYALPTP